MSNYTAVLGELASGSERGKGAITESEFNEKKRALMDKI